MIPITVNYQLKFHDERSNMFRYTKMASNEDAILIIQAILDGYRFVDMVDEIETLENIYNEIITGINSSIDKNGFYLKHGTTDVLDVFDLCIEFSEDLCS